MPTPAHDPLTDDLNGDGAAQRRCVLTGARDEPGLLLRLAQGPDGQVAPDLAHRLPGRGAWVTVDRALVEAAVANGRLRAALARAWKTAPAGIAGLDTLVAIIDAGLERRACDRLGLERRAGHLVTGADKVMEAVNRDRLSALLHASDAAEDGVNRLVQRFDGVRLPSILTRDELSLALGRENVVHVGVIDPKAAIRLAGVLGCLSRWRHSQPDVSNDNG